MLDAICLQDDLVPVWHGRPHYKRCSLLLKALQCACLLLIVFLIGGVFLKKKKQINSSPKGNSLPVLKTSVGGRNG